MPQAPDKTPAVTHQPPLDSPSPGRTLSGRDASLVFDSLDLALLIVDRAGIVHKRNAPAKRLLPNTRDIEQVLADVRFLGPFAGWAEELRTVIELGNSTRHAAALTHAQTRSPRLITIRCMPLVDAESATPNRAVIRIEEESGADGLDERLELSKRLVALGKLAAQVAHELNNPLDGILRYVNMALRLVNDPRESKLKSYLTESRIGLLRMVQIIGELLEFSRASDGEFDGMPVNAVVEEAIRATTADRNQIVVAVDFQKQEMPLVHGSRLYQVCCNLIRNAIDAMPHGGRLCVTTGLVNEDVVIRVADTGVGLPRDVERLFEAFYTTKAPGKGTGLGLAISKDFVEDMQGRITAEPGEEGGAVFTVRIPLRSFDRPSRAIQSRRGWQGRSPSWSDSASMRGSSPDAR